MKEAKKRKTKKEILLENEGLLLRCAQAEKALHALWCAETDACVVPGTRGEQALRESEARFRTLAEATFEGIVISQDGRVVESNEQFARMHGYEPQEVIGKAATDFVAPQDHTRLLEGLGCGRERIGEFRAVRKDGSEFTIEAHGRPILHNGRPARVSALRDITERKRGERIVRESLDDLDRAQAVAHTGSWRLNVQRNELLWSNENHRIFGVPPGTPLSYETFLSIVHPDDREYVDQQWQAALRGEPYDIDHRIIVGDSVKWVREQATLEFDDQNNLLGGFGTTQDITQRKESEIAARQLAQFPEQNPNPVMRVSAAGGLLYVNRPAREWLDSVDTTDDHRVTIVMESLISAALRHGTVVRSEFANPAGQVMLFSAIRPPGESYVNVYGLDVTQRKQMEIALIRAHGELEQKVQERTAELEATNRALQNEVAVRRKAEEVQRASAEMIQDLYNNAPCGYHSLDENGVFVRINDTELRWLGYTRDEVVGRMKFSDILAPQGVEVFREMFSRLKERGEMRDLEIEMTRKDGTIFPALLSASAVRDDEGAFLMCRSTVFDISERKKAEEEAMRAAHLASIGELAAGVAHEINNPINSIINYADIIADQAGRDAPQYPMAEEIRKEGWRIASIVKGLLSFSRDTKGRKTPVAVGDIVSAALTLTNAFMRKDAITVRLAVPENLPAVYGNAQELQQVVLNIISNARYALQEKYPHADDDKILEIMGETVMKGARPAVRLIFRDHGTGIPSSVLPRLYEPFFTTKSGSVGTGLGLSISAKIVANHGGQLIIDSKEGSYTEATVELPVSVEEGGAGVQ